MKKISNQEFRDIYGAVASKYDSILSAYALSRRQYILINWAEGDCLEVGAGTGELSKYLKEDHHVVATDIAPSMVEQIRLKLDIEAHVCDAQELPFEDASFDTVIASECIYLMDSQEKFVKEAQRVLKPGGRLIISATTGYGIFLGRIRNVLRFFGFSKMYFDDPNRNYMSIRRFQRLFDKTDFTMKNIRHVVLVPFESFDAINRFCEKIFFNKFGLHILVNAQKT